VRRSTRLLAFAVPAVLVTVPVALAGADSTAGGRAVEAPRAAVAAIEPPPEPSRPPAALIVRVRPGATVALRTRPHGPVALRAGDTTEFGSPQRLGVVRRRGPWLGVSTPSLLNGTLGWVHRESAAVAIERTRWSIRVDISERSVVLRKGGRAVRRLRVAVGRPGSPTPTGRFAVTDKLSGGSYSPYYGCCILALSATQPHTPPGWAGGNRMAIHGTSDPSSIGSAASAGCLRAADSDLQLLMKQVPVGTPVAIRR